MAVSMLKLVVAAASLFLVNCQYYQTHEIVAPKPVVTPATVTVTESVWKTHPLRVIITSDVWVTETTNVQEIVTALSTVYQFVPVAPRTQTSIVRVTSTPVYISTIEILVTPTRTFTTVYTSFTTTTETVRFWQSITHVSTVHSVETVPVWTTQTLVQEDTTTITSVFTTIVTSTTRAYA
uniref:NDF protein n=1 Tax=Neocaridina denticulata sinensis TaxID=274643 RepID=A0A8F9RUU5_NEODE|nr:NDF protein [Neocaridina denticulata sinensis]